MHYSLGQAWVISWRFLQWRSSTLTWYSKFLRWGRNRYHRISEWSVEWHLVRPECRMIAANWECYLRCHWYQVKCTWDWWYMMKTFVDDSYNIVFKTCMKVWRITNLVCWAGHLEIQYILLFKFSGRLEKHVTGWWSSVNWIIF